MPRGGTAILCPDKLQRYRAPAKINLTVSKCTGRLADDGYHRAGKSWWPLPIYGDRLFISKSETSQSAIERAFCCRNMSARR